MQTAPHGHETVKFDEERHIINGDPDLPRFYNIRQLYPGCIPEVFEQGSCGACWSFSAVGMLGDRICMQTGLDITLSPQDMVSCAFEQYGCMGGYLIPAVDYLVSEGVSTSSCRPYKDKDELCKYECDNEELPYEKYYCKPGSFKVMTTVEEIQKELYENGPVIVSLNVWEDFLNYGGGVYEHVSGGWIGGHSIRLVGWGHDVDNDDSLYWIGQNQWTYDWGIGGYAYIKAGSVEIDSWAMACDPDLDAIK